MPKVPGAAPAGVEFRLEVLSDTFIYRRRSPASNPGGNGTLPVFHRVSTSVSRASSYSSLLVAIN